MASAGRLAEILARLPGIGLRQSRRLAYFLLETNLELREELIRELSSVRENVMQCGECYRYFESNDKASPLCFVCRNTETDKEHLMIVEKDIDLENILKSGVYSGRYFVLGGLMSIIQKQPTRHSVRINELLELIKKNNVLNAMIQFRVNKTIIYF